MAYSWTKSQYKGLRYREHPSKTLGVGRSKRPFRYYTAVYKWQGKVITDVYGWEGERIRNEEEAYDIHRELWQNRKNQTPPFTLKERDKLAAQHLQEEEDRKQREILKNISFAQVFTEHYLANAQSKRRNANSWKREESLFRIWIEPVVGEMPLRKIKPLNVEHVSKKMRDNDLAPRSIEYALAVIRQVFQFALKNEIYYGPNPAAGALVRRPKFDNVKQRALTPTEIKILLSELSRRSQDLHDIAMFSLYTGCRAGEVFSLTWGSVDLFNSVATLIRTKSGKNREVYLDPELKKILANRRPPTAKPNDLIFPDRNGNKIIRISSTFGRVIDFLGFNDGVTENIHRVTFHSLRRTFATWLKDDTDNDLNIHDIKELLGHASIVTTERYLAVDREKLKKSALKIRKRLA
jgi:integrase